MPQSAMPCYERGNPEALNKSWRDQRLLVALRTGSSSAFEELQKRYSSRLYKRILSITRNHEDAEDALQETFMHAFLAIHSFENRSQLFTWLTKIAINSALMIVRRRRRANAEVSLTPPSGAPAEFQKCDIRDSGPTPEETCDLKQRLERMFSAINRLDPTLRNAVEIQITQKCSLKQMARISILQNRRVGPGVAANVLRGVV